LSAVRRDDRGSATVEFVVPLVYLVVTLGRLQAASFAVDSAARAGVRTFTRAPDDATAQSRAAAAVRLAVGDQGFAGGVPPTVQVTCSASPCLTSQGRVAVQVSLDVVLPGVPAVLDAVVPTHVTVRSTQLGVVDVFRAAVAPVTGAAAAAGAP
jgi:Flp pilus assembly protein TadG